MFGAILYGSQNEQRWPTRIEEIAPHIHTGTLHNPDLPEYEIGFAYIRPAGTVGWAAAENKRLAFYERFEQWPGGVRVSHTDGSVERIEDQERFERLVAERGPRGAASSQSFGRLFEEGGRGMILVRSFTVPRQNGRKRAGSPSTNLKLTQHFVYVRAARVQNAASMEKSDAELVHAALWAAWTR